MTPFAIGARLLLAIGVVILFGCSSTPARNEAIATSAVHHALKMQGKPYRYGGNNPAGFDCSGLVQYSYARAGLSLPHGTRNLLRSSRRIARDELQRGDLVFFTQEGRKSGHVALYLGDDRFVHAPSSGKKVHVAGFDDPYWKRHFTEARRLEYD